MIVLVLYVVALVLFILSAVGVSAPRVNLTAAGLAAWVAAELLGGAGR